MYYVIASPESEDGKDSLAGNNCSCIWIIPHVEMLVKTGYPDEPNKSKGGPRTRLLQLQALATPSASEDAAGSRFGLEGCALEPLQCKLQ